MNCPYRMYAATTQMAFFSTLLRLLDRGICGLDVQPVHHLNVVRDPFSTSYWGEKPNSFFARDISKDTVSVVMLHQIIQSGSDFNICPGVDSSDAFGEQATQILVELLLSIPSGKVFNK